MTLVEGTRLGFYEIVSALGAGGIGEVYRARDTRLERTMAIKILPDHVANDPDLYARFKREDRAVADTLNALSSDRVHRRGSSLEDTVTYVTDRAGQWFDPEVVKAMRALHERGTLVPATDAGGGDGEREEEP